MRYIFLIILVFFPTPVFAFCAETGSTIVYINGILTSKAKAESDLNSLQEEYRKRTGDYSPDFINGYNPSHLAGVGDLVQSVTQAYRVSVSDFDLKTILLQIHPQVETRRLLLVGHSQGNFYTNAMYDYLLAHGEPKEAVGVYAVATPASTVAGDGAYLNNSNDKLLQLVAGLAAGWRSQSPLLFNITLPLSFEEEASSLGGHSFSDVYLAQAPERIVSDISRQISALEPTFAGEGECFTPPEQELGYAAEKSLFVVADTAAGVAKTGLFALNSLGNATLAAVGAAWDMLAGVQQAQVDAVSNTAATLADKEHTEKNFNIVRTVYGSSVSPSDLEDLLGPNASQGGAVALAVEPPIAELLQEMPAPASPEPVIPTETGVWVPKSSGGGSSASQLASDTTSPSPPVPPPVLFNASTTPPALSIDECSYSLTASFCFIPSTTAMFSWSAVAGAVEYDVYINNAKVAATPGTFFVAALPDQATSTVSITAVDAVGAATTSAPQQAYVFTSPVVINEVAWSGTYSSAADQWVELKNRTPYALDMSKLTLVATEGGSQYVPLAGTIDISGLYLLQRTSGVFWRNNPAAQSGGDFVLLSQTGEQLALEWRGSSATTTLDSTPPISACGGWCAGSLPTTNYADAYGNPTPVSMERMNADASGGASSNWAGNDGYTTTGLERNQQKIIGTPGAANSARWPLAGFFCDGDASIMTPGSAAVAYHPTSTHCTALGGRAPQSYSVGGRVFKGEVGSSTVYTSVSFFGRPSGSAKAASFSMNVSSASDGEKFFVALWIYSTNIGGSYSANLVSPMQTYLLTGAQASSTVPTQPALDLIVMPFTYQP